MATDAGASARADAFAIVAAELLGPVAFITGEQARLRTDEWGNVVLPFKPATNVSLITYDSGATQDLQYIKVDGQTVSGLPRLCWATVTYDHGWTEDAVPLIVRTIIGRLQSRLLRTPDDNVRSESVGSYRVDFIPGPAWLTGEEKTALFPYRRVVAGNTASASTSTEAPEIATPAGSFFSEWGGG